MKGIQYPKIVSYKPSLNKGVFAVLVSCVSIGLFAIPLPAEAFNPFADIGDALAEAMVWAGAVIIGLVFWVFNWIGILVLAIASLVLQAMMSFVLEAGYTPYTDLSVLVGWRVVRDIAHMVLIFALLAIGISTILGIRLNDRDESVGKQLITFIAIAIVIHFTPLITGVIIDISNIFTKIFFDQAQSAVGGFGDHHPFGSSWEDFDKIGDARGAAGYTLGLIISLFYSIGAATVLFSASFILIARVIAIQILVILSPLAFVARLLPGGRQKFEQWFHQFIQWCFLPVGMGLFLWLSAVILANGMAACTEAITYQEQFHDLGGDRAKLGSYVQSNIGIDTSTPEANVAANQIIGGSNLCKATVSGMALATIVAGIFISASTSAYGAQIITKRAKSAFVSVSKYAARQGIRASAAIATRGASETLRRTGGGLRRGSGRLQTSNNRMLRGIGKATDIVGAGAGGMGSGMDWTGRKLDQAIKDPSSLNIKDLPGEVAQDYLQSRAKGGKQEEIATNVSRGLRRVGMHGQADNIQTNLDKIGDLSEVRTTMKGFSDQALKDILANPDIWNTQGGKERQMVAFEMLSEKPKGRETIQKLVRDGKVDLDKIAQATQKHGQELKYGRDSVDAHIALAAMGGDTSNLSDSDKHEMETLKGKWNRESSGDIRTARREYENAKMDEDPTALKAIATNEEERIEKRLAAASLLSDTELQSINSATRFELASRADETGVEVGQGQNRHHLSDRMYASITEDDKTKLRLTSEDEKKIQESTIDYAIHQNDRMKKNAPREDLETLTRRATETHKNNRNQQMTTLMKIAEDHGIEEMKKVIGNLNDDAKTYFTGDAKSIENITGGTGKNKKQGGFSTGDLFKAADGDTDAATRVRTSMAREALRDNERIGTDDLQQDLQSTSETRVIAAATELYNRGEYDAVQNAGLSKEQTQKIQEVAKHIDLTSERKTQQETKDKNAFTVQEVGEALSGNTTAQEKIIARSERAAYATTRKTFVNTEKGERNKLKDKDEVVRMLNNEHTDDRVRKHLIATILSTDDGEKTLKEMIQNKEVDQSRIEIETQDKTLQHIQIGEGAAAEPAQVVVERIQEDVKDDDYVWAAPETVRVTEDTQTNLHAQHRDVARQERKKADIQSERFEKQQRETQEIIKTQNEEIRQAENVIRDFEARGLSAPEQEERIDAAQKKIQEAEEALLDQEKKHKQAQQIASEHEQRAVESKTERDRTRSWRPETDLGGGSGSGPTPQPPPTPIPPPIPTPTPIPSKPPETYRQPPENPYTENLRDRTLERHNREQRRRTEEGRRDREERERQHRTTENQRVRREQSQEEQQEIMEDNDRYDTPEIRKFREETRRIAEETDERERLRTEEAQRRFWKERGETNQERMQQTRKGKQRQEIQEVTQRRIAEHQSALQKEDEQFRQSLHQEAQQASEEAQRSEQTRKEREETEARNRAAEQSQHQQKTDYDTDRARRRQDERRKRNKPQDSRNQQDDDENGTQKPRNRRTNRRRNRNPRYREQLPENTDGLDRYDIEYGDLQQDD